MPEWTEGVAAGEQQEEACTCREYGVIWISEQHFHSDKQILFAHLDLLGENKVHMNEQKYT